MLALDWSALGQVVLAGACVGLVARLFTLISTGTRRGFKYEVREEVKVMLDDDKMIRKELSREKSDSLRRELDRIWAAVDDLRGRAGQ